MAADVNPDRVARIVLWEFYGDAAAAQRYYELIAASQGELTATYATAAAILAERRKEAVGCSE